VKKKIVWLAVSYLMVLSLVLASCAPAVEEEEEEVTVSEEEEEEVTAPEEVAPAPETVAFPDEKLGAAIKDALGKPVGEEITVVELATLTTLGAESSNITDLSGLEYCTNLTGLGLRGNQINDISPLANLTSLTRLALMGNQISDISPLENLTNLFFINLFNNKISDISPLSNLTSLTDLTLWENQISDITPLVENSGLGAGDKVWLEDNNLDLSEASEDMENIKALEDRGVVVYYE